MNRKKLILVLIMLGMLSGCGGKRHACEDELIIVDVTKTDYPKKELILQDFMDVEYVALETKDDFLNQGYVMDIGKEIILVKNYNDNGDIFVYDRTGKALQKINHKGQSREEYTNILGISLDEDNGEIFINNHFSQKIVVYDLYGKFIRSFNYKENYGDMFYTEIFNYDREHLICYDAYNEKIPFVLISKQNGSITKEIKIPFNKKKLLEITLKNNDEIITKGPGPYRSIIPYNGNWLLLEVSSDTVYTFLRDYSLHPFIVRTPPVQSMNPEVFLVLRFFSNRYYFMETIKNVYDWNTREGFPRTFMMYDNREKAMCKYTVYNGDFSNKKEVYMNVTRPMNHEIESWYPFEAHRLIESYKKGELKGKLKEIASKLDEDDNPVIMLIKHRK